MHGISHGVIFLPTDLPEKSMRVLKKARDLRALPGWSTDIFLDDSFKKYLDRPKSTHTPPPNDIEPAEPGPIATPAQSSASLCQIFPNLMPHLPQTKSTLSACRMFSSHLALSRCTALSYGGCMRARVAMRGIVVEPSLSSTQPVRLTRRISRICVCTLLCFIFLPVVMCLSGSTDMRMNLRNIRRWYEPSLLWTSCGRWHQHWRRCVMDGQAAEYLGRYLGRCPSSSSAQGHRI